MSYREYKQREGPYLGLLREVGIHLHALLGGGKDGIREALNTSIFRQSSLEVTLPVEGVALLLHVKCLLDYKYCKG